MKARRPRLRRGERGRECAGGEHPAGPDLRLVGGGPPVIADPGACQVDHRVDARERRVARVGGARVPADLADRPGAGRRIAGRPVAGRSACLPACPRRRAAAA